MGNSETLRKMGNASPGGSKCKQGNCFPQFCVLGIREADFSVKAVIFPLVSSSCLNFHLARGTISYQNRVTCEWPRLLNVALQLAIFILFFFFLLEDLARRLSNACNRWKKKPALLRWRDLKHQCIQTTLHPYPSLNGWDVTKDMKSQEVC